jgi:glycosyltransferase involved in cell wall biosynthesis
LDARELAAWHLVLDASYKEMISTIVLTYNDEIQIANCLESIRDLSDDIIIIDSFSTDRTLDICRSYGCRVYQNPFVNQAIQFNWALDNVELKHGWVLRIDSDEIVPDKLKAEILRRAGAEPGVAGYYLNRRVYWMNQWLRHGRMYPHYILRLFKKGCAHYEERTEEHLVLDGTAAKMENDFLENNLKTTLDYFTQKHLATARGELKEILDRKDRSQTSSLTIEPKLFGEKINRTRWFKEKVYARTPVFLRPVAYFFLRYFIYFGFLDGVPGLIWHVLQGFWYRFYIDSKIYEHRLQSGAGQTDLSKI